MNFNMFKTTIKHKVLAHYGTGQIILKAILKLNENSFPGIKIGRQLSTGFYAMLFGNGQLIGQQCEDTK